MYVDAGLNAAAEKTDISVREFLDGPEEDGSTSIRVEVKKEEESKKGDEESTSDKNKRDDEEKLLVAGNSYLLVVKYLTQSNRLFINSVHIYIM